jgi:hypothetical protein
VSARASAVVERLVAGVLVETGDVAYELSEVARVGVVRGAVPPAEVRNRAQRDGGEVEGHLL